MKLATPGEHGANSHVQKAVSWLATARTEGLNNLGNYAWYTDNSGDLTHPVGERLANSWGLYDMHGNVWEWCQDYFDSYPGGIAVDPQGPATGSDRVLRGGYWLILARYCRSALRYYAYPDYRSSLTGFRAVLAPGQP